MGPAQIGFCPPFPPPLSAGWAELPPLPPLPPPPPLGGCWLGGAQSGVVAIGPAQIGFWPPPPPPPPGSLSAIGITAWGALPPPPPLPPLPPLPPPLLGGVHGMAESGVPHSGLCPPPP